MQAKFFFKYGERGYKFVKPDGSDAGGGTEGGLILVQKKIKEGWLPSQKKK